MQKLVVANLEKFNLYNRRYTGSKLKLIDWIKKIIINK